MSKNNTKKSPSLKLANKINELEEVLKATFELHHKDHSPIENMKIRNAAEAIMPKQSEISKLTDLINKELLLNGTESQKRDSTESQERDSEIVEQLSELVQKSVEITSNKSILNDMEGYIRLTEDEINDIINTVEPIRENKSENFQSSETGDGPITCTSF